MTAGEPGGSFDGMMLIRVRVAPSRIHGLGLQAVDVLPAGTPVWKFQPGFDQVFSPAAAAALPALARDYLRHYGFGRKSDGHIVLSGDASRFMNHAADPSTGVPPDAADASVTVALRDIAAGEELTCDYFAFDADAAAKLTPVEPA